MAERLLDVRHLHTSFFTHLGEVKAIRDVSFHVDKSEIIGIVGESGSGKSVTSLSVMGLLAHPGKVTEGEILFKGEDLLKKKKREMRKIQGNQISMIFQDPMTSLNPLFTIGNQITEVLHTHNKMGRAKANERAVEMLRMVGIPSPEKRVRSYPHEFSGGMRQRAMIAMALSSEPDLLIADEPTTALDVTIQAQVLALMKELNERLGTATILITHNLGCASSICDRILVMYGGKIMEEGSTEEIFYEPRHPLYHGSVKFRSEGQRRTVQAETGSHSGNAAGYASSAYGMPLLSQMQICGEGLRFHGSAGIPAERNPSGQLFQMPPRCSCK